MMRVLFFCVALLFVFPAQAQQLTLQSECHNGDPVLEPHSADYKPGVDVDGKPVAPADVESAATKAISYPLVIPVELDDLRSLDLVDLDTDVAYVTLFEDGRIEYNGRDISDIASHQCIEELKAVELDPPPEEGVPVASAEKEDPAKDVSKAPEASGQKAADDVPSAAPDKGKEELDNIIQNVTEKPSEEPAVETSKDQIKDE